MHHPSDRTYCSRCFTSTRPGWKDHKSDDHDVLIKLIIDCDFVSVPVTHLELLTVELNLDYNKS